MSHSSETTADVVVVGAGAAGLVAAATAAAAGARVVLVESASELGGTAALSIGEFWIPNNRHLAGQGIVDTEPECLRLMARLSYQSRYDPDSATLGLTPREYELLVTFYRRANEALEHLEHLGALRSRISPAAYGDPLGHPEYYSELPENRVPQGRHLIVDDGDPSFGPRGAAYVQQLSDYLNRVGTKVLKDHRVVTVEQDPDGRVVAVVAESPHGLKRIGANRGIVFATGGFGHDPAARDTFLRGPVDAVAAVTTNTGDFLRIGGELGAGLGNMTHAYLGNCAFELGLAAPRIPQLLHFPFGDSMLWVDRTGRRVVNEKAVFTDRAQVHFDWEPSLPGFGKRPLIQIFDRTVFHGGRARYPFSVPGQGSEHIMTADTLAALSDAIDSRVKKLSAHTGAVRLCPEFSVALEASVNRFNQLASQGVDVDYGRGTTPIETCYERPLHPDLRNVTMAPLDSEGPYYAMLIGPAMFDTAGGPLINANAQVLDMRGQPIRGLFAAGCCAASPGGQGYWSGGTPIGLALTFGYLAGAAAASSATMNRA